MNIILTPVSLVVNALVAVGDSVIYLLKKPVDLLTTAGSKRKRKSGTFKIRKPRKKVFAPLLTVIERILNARRINSERAKIRKLA